MNPINHQLVVYGEMTKLITKIETLETEMTSVKSRLDALEAE